MANRWGNHGNSGWLYFSGLLNHCRWWCSHEIERCLLLGRKVMTNLDSILKSRDYFVNKGPSSQGYGFSSGHVWMWELDYKESWAPKNWYFWTVVLEKTLRVPWIARRSNVSILKEISPGCSLEGLILKLKLQYFGHLIRRADSLEKTLMLERLRAGGEGDDRGWDGWMASPTWWTWVWVNSGSWWGTGKPGVLRFLGLHRVGYDWATELNWTEEISYIPDILFLTSFVEQHSSFPVVVRINHQACRVNFFFWPLDSEAWAPNAWPVLLCY